MTRNTFFIRSAVVAVVFGCAIALISSTPTAQSLSFTIRQPQAGTAPPQAGAAPPQTGSAPPQAGTAPPQGDAANEPQWRCQFPAISRARADATVSTLAELESALAARTSGHRVVWIENWAVIEIAVTDHRREPNHYALRVPPNVTLASGRSPTEPGGLLYFSRRAEHPRFMMRLDSCTRVTGLRLQGPTRSTARIYSDPSNPGHLIEVPANTAVEIREVDNVLIDNNEFFDWPGAGVYLRGTGNEYRAARTIRVTGNFFHHNLRCGFGNAVQVNGLGRTSPIGGYAYIDRNVFNYNRHAVAGDGHPKIGYIAERNLVLSGGKKCHSSVPVGYYNQHFDMHGYGDDGYGGDAGEFIDLRYNTIRGEQDYYVTRTRPAFMLRGTPTGRASFYGNVVVHENRGEAISFKGVRWHEDDPNPPFREWGNQYNVDTSKELAVGDFDADGHADVFQATGTVWVYSARGQSNWRVLNTRSERLPQLLFGDFNGDGKTDVFTQRGSQWLVSYGGTRAWTTLAGGSAVDTRRYRIGDFDGDGKADIFRANGTQWFYSSAGATGWLELARSRQREDRLRFGDFNGDGITDVFGLADGHWSVSYGGQTGWRWLNNLLSSNLAELVFADFNGDRITDIARQKGAHYEVAWGGFGDWNELHEGAGHEQFLSLTSMLLGDFTGDRRADVLHYRAYLVDVIPIPAGSVSVRGKDHFVISSRGSRPFSIWSRYEMR